ARSLLEVGCGTGFVLEGMRRARPNIELVGAELFEEGLLVARRRLPAMPLVRLDARQLRVEEAFDVVAAFDVLEHIREDALVLARLAAAARPGGGLLVTVPQHPKLWSVADDVAAHVRRYTRQELVRKVEAAGLEVVRVTSFVSMLLPLLALSRILGARTPESYEVEREFSSPRIVDRSLEAVMTAERATIRRGGSFPLGGSLVPLAAR